MSNHLAQRSFSALRWGYAGYLARATATFGTGVVLARLLGPKPFGQIAAATLVFGIANQLADGGFTNALVQAEALTAADIGFAFVVQLAIGAGLSAACFLAAPSCAALCHDPAISAVLRALSAVFLLQAFGQTSTAVLKRHMAFRAIQTAQVTSYIIGYAVVGIGMAWGGCGVWSLVCAMLVQSALYSVLAFTRVRHPIVPRFSLERVHLARFGLKVTGANVLNWSITNADNACVGHLFGSAALGLYSRAYNTVSTPVDSIVSIWQQVLLSACSRVSGDKQTVRRAYLGSLSAISLILLPPLWSVAGCALTVVEALYGGRWASAAPVLTPLAMAVSIHAAMALSGPILSAADLVHEEVRAQAMSLAATIAIFVVTGHVSVLALAWGVFAAYVVRFTLMTRPTLRLLGITWREVGKVTLGPLSLGSVALLLAFAIDRACRYRSLPPWPRALLIASAVVTTCVGAIAFGGHRVCSPELVRMAGQISPALPRLVSSRLQAIEAKQRTRILGSATLEAEYILAVEGGARQARPRLPIPLGGRMRGD